jgi:putative ATP-dependent endonuclease of the OLD family
MRLAKLILTNFRCFGPQEMSVDFDDLTAIIGANSAGKTALLYAIQKLFGTSSRDREIRRSDFHVPIDKKPEAMEHGDLQIEAIIEFPELVEESGSSESTVPPFFERMVIDGPGSKPYLRIRLEANWQKGHSPEGDIDSKLQFITSPVGETISDDNRVPVSSHHRSSIQTIYVPAIRQPSSQLRNASGTILWRILNGVKWPDDIEGRIEEKSLEMNAIFDEQPAVKQIRRILAGQWQSLHRDVRYTDAIVKFSSSDLESVLKRIEVEFAPTETSRAYDIDDLGEGLRSLFYFSLVNSLLEIESIMLQVGGDKELKDAFSFDPPGLTILAVEEPENHISPHLLGRVVENLRRISRKANAQVILTSHTPAIIKRVDPESIRHLRICTARHCSLPNRVLLPGKEDEAYKYVKEAIWAYPELYFARLVVFGEGDSEEIVIPKSIRALLSGLDDSGISVVPLGGRHVNHFWKLLSTLEIPFLTLLDLDSERSGGGWARIQYVLNQLLKIGTPKEKLFGTWLSEENFQQMHTWTIQNEEDRKLLMSWTGFLEKFGIFFSEPLDLDFSMLKAYSSEYMKTAPATGGPRIPDSAKDPAAFNSKLEKAIQATLKEEGGEGHSFTDEERKLMIWYAYLFLSRSKPSTHILALVGIEDETFMDKIPTPLRNLVEKAKEALKDDPFSSASERG